MKGLLTVVAVSQLSTVCACASWIRLLKISLSWVLCFERQMRACGKQRRFRASCDRLVQSTAKCELSDSHFAIRGPGLCVYVSAQDFVPSQLFTALLGAGVVRTLCSSASARQQPISTDGTDAVAPLESHQLEEGGATAAAAACLTAAAGHQETGDREGLPSTPTQTQARGGAGWGGR